MTQPDDHVKKHLENRRIDPATLSDDVIKKFNKFSEGELKKADDLGAFLEVRYKKIVGPRTSGASSIDVNVEHDRGPFNGRAEITGTVGACRANPAPPTGS